MGTTEQPEFFAKLKKLTDTFIKEFNPKYFTLSQAASLAEKILEIVNEIRHLLSIQAAFVYPIENTIKDLNAYRSTYPSPYPPDSFLALTYKFYLRHITEDTGCLYALVAKIPNVSLSEELSQNFKRYITSLNELVNPPQQRVTPFISPQPLEDQRSWVCN